MIHNHEVGRSFLPLATKRVQILLLDSFFVYLDYEILLSISFIVSSKDKYYIGYSHNPEKESVEHNLGATPSTRPGRPWIIVYKEECADKTAAIKRESRDKKNEKQEIS